MAEPPKLYGSRAPAIVLKTSDCYTREPDNSGSLSGVLREPQIINILQLIQDQHGVTTTLQHWYKNNLHRSAEDL
jgi:hypothetical protein